LRDDELGFSFKGSRFGKEDLFSMLCEGSGVLKAREEGFGNGNGRSIFANTSPK
jgi:hypothetical protein